MELQEADRRGGEDVKKEISGDSVHQNVMSHQLHSEPENPATVPPDAPAAFSLSRPRNQFIFFRSSSVQMGDLKPVA